MTTSTPVALFERREIHIRVSNPDRSTTDILGGIGSGASFCLPKPGIYSLEGPNGIGKTLLLKYLVGLDSPFAARKRVDIPTYVDGKPVRIQHTSDAMRNGVVAVFNEDALIPSMTVMDQILMRHAVPKWRHVIQVTRKKLLESKPVQSISEYLPSDLVPKWLESTDEYSRLRSVLAAAASAHLAQFGIGNSVLERLPRELSAGQAAIVKLIVALLTERIRVLFLDEAFSGIQASLWPKLVDYLREWQDRSASAVVVVSHNADEILRWSPSERFTIRDQAIRSIGPTGHDVLFAGLPSRPQSIPLFLPPVQQPLEWLIKSNSHAVILCDRNLLTHAATLDICQRVAQITGMPYKMIPVEAEESKKDVTQFLGLAEEALDGLAGQTGTILVIGGGITLNIGGMVAATIYRGKFPAIFIPTTVMAMADVAIGSKMSLNFSSQRASRVWKHALSVYANPSAVVLDPRYLDTLPAREKIYGLSECLKHGLLQDHHLFAQTLELIRHQNPDPRRCFEIARRVMYLKARLLVHDPWEEDSARLLLYGHMHAHSLERASALRIPHGSSVYFGILTELALAGAESVLHEVEEVVKLRQEEICDQWKLVTPDQLLDAYDHDAHATPHSYSAIVLERPGEYGETFGSPRMQAVRREDLFFQANKVLRAYT